MKKTRKFIFLLILAFLLLIENEIYALSLRNEKGKTKAGSSGGLHKPSYNPGGEEFEQDREFFEVYQKKYNQGGDNSEYMNPNCDFSGIPGARLIEETSVERLGMKELQDISSKKYFCVSNSEIPEELMFLVESECEQEFYNAPSSKNDYSLKQKKEMIKQISSSEIKKNKNLNEFNYQNQEEECDDDFQIEKTNFSKNNQNCETTIDSSNENEPLIKFKE